tara:strand:- start:181 stop:435 length:255 start_codon:yes stop_codon:yes gene_type:complete
MSSFKELKNKIQGKTTPPPTPQPKETTLPTIDNIKEFEPEEARYMLNLIARTDFKGQDVQTIYNIVFKLQNIIKESLKETDGPI